MPESLFVEILFGMSSQKQSMMNGDVRDVGGPCFGWERIILGVGFFLRWFIPCVCGFESPLPFRIEVVEKGTEWPVPLVEFRTTNQVSFVTDNAGLIAFDMPEMMEKEIWFDVSGHGYGVEKDGFGYQGVRLKPCRGGKARVEVQRRILARRIGRMTGGGLFAESQKLGEELDWKESGIVGSDSVQCVPYHGRWLWLWGDSNVPRYPLGIFSSAGAHSEGFARNALVPPFRPTWDYVRDEEGRPRGIAPIPGDGPTWVFGMVAMKDREGRDQVGGYYYKIKGMLDAYETGLAVWKEEKQVFERVSVVWRKESGQAQPKSVPSGQAASWSDPNGIEWLIFGNPFPYMRCPATFEAWSDRSKWEELSPQEQVLSSEGRKVTPHSGAIGYHPWRKRWVAVFVEKNGAPSKLGEVWYAEADLPTGPWGTAVKVLSHDHYTFYNPRLHLEFTPAGEPWLYFEGTYTALFEPKARTTPRYDYNQILYRLDLDDPRLKPAQKH